MQYRYISNKYEMQEVTIELITNHHVNRVFDYAGLFPNRSLSILLFAKWRGTGEQFFTFFSKQPKTFNKTIPYNIIPKRARVCCAIAKVVILTDCHYTILRCVSMRPEYEFIVFDTYNIAKITNVFSICSLFAILRFWKYNRYRCEVNSLDSYLFSI